MAAGNATSNVYVGNLPAGTTPEQIEAEFAQYGSISNVEFPAFRPRTRPRPVFCWVTFSNPGEAAAAVGAANGAQFNGRTMRVELQLNDEAREVRREERRAARPERAPRAEGAAAGGARRRRRRRKPLMEAGPTNVFIGRIPREDINEESARELCGAFGAVEEVAIGRNNLFMCVRFATAEQAQACIAGLNGKDFDGRAAQVELVAPKEESPEVAARAPRGSAPRAPRGAGRARPRRQPDGAAVFLGNIDRDVSAEDVLDFFGQDEVARVRMRGRWALVVFNSPEQADAALVNNGADLNGHAVVVEKMGKGREASE